MPQAGVGVSHCGEQSDRSSDTKLSHRKDHSSAPWGDKRVQPHRHLYPALSVLHISQKRAEVLSADASGNINAKERT